MEIEQIKYWLALNRTSGIGRARFQRLESYFDSMEAAWSAGAAELRAAGLDRRAVRAVVDGRRTVDPDAEADRLLRSGVRALTWHDDEYPARLKEIYDLPPLLYVRGTLHPEDARSVAVVGTRNPSHYGREVAEQMVYDIACAGVTIVSGLARGVDGIAHRVTLDAGQRTIAVLGSGLDIIYPPEHTNLSEQIADNGALLSEYPLGTKPDSRNFPRRNRIMSGMTLGTLVIEAGGKSGALITARQALEENREVFAVPGRISSENSKGTNKLIRKGEAKLVTSYEDVLEELNLTAVERQIEMAALFPEDDDEADLLRYITFDPVHVDEVCRSTGRTASDVSSTLAMMELKGLVKQVGGMNYVRMREVSDEYSASAV
ncbi:MAG: DNA-processing protein DprA [Chloroflexota bacterium]|nr:DNA-processing protein DprA [Chloroflexota bacterium]